MNTLVKIKSELTEALKAGGTAKALALRYLLAEIHNAEIAKGKDAQLTDEELAVVLQKQVKQRQESIEAYKAGGRDDLVKKEQSELNLIKSYLPEQLSEEEIRELAQAVVKEVGVQGLADMGKVMGVLMPKIRGRADGSLVGGIVRELLSQNG